MRRRAPLCAMINDRYVANIINVSLAAFTLTMHICQLKIQSNDKCRIENHLNSLHTTPHQDVAQLDALSANNPIVTLSQAANTSGDF